LFSGICVSHRGKLIDIDPSTGTAIMATRATPTDAISSITPLPAAAASLPPLESGDVLSRAEFERRNEAMLDLKKAELIDGVVHVGAAVSLSHAVAHSDLNALFKMYVLETPGVQSCDNVTVRLGLDNILQPDLLLRRTVGGLSHVGEYVEGPPELVAEIATSSVSRDLHSKLAVYRQHGVREYVVWRTLDQQIDWFQLDNGGYRQPLADERGLLRSYEFPGLWINGAALAKGDMAGAVASFKEGLGSPEHAEFVARQSAGH
jgi:Uma2 family endonuclease